MRVEPEPKPRRILGWEVRRVPRDRRDSPPLALILLFAGLAGVALHDIAYRQTGGDDFEAFGVISHAGLDMLAVTLFLALIAAVHERVRS